MRSFDLFGDDSLFDAPLPGQLQPRGGSWGHTLMPPNEAEDDDPAGRSMPSLDDSWFNVAVVFEKHLPKPVAKVVKERPRLVLDLPTSEELFIFATGLGFGLLGGAVACVTLAIVL